VATGGSADTEERTLTVPITSTTLPTSARASLERGTLQDTAPQLISPFNSLVMLPRKAGVLQGNKVEFSLWYTGPSSSEAVLTVPAPGLSLSKVPPGGRYSWYANGVLLGNNAEGSLTETGPGSVYTAPSCSPAGNPVLVAVKVINPDDPYAEYRQPRARVWVVPPNWQFTWQDGEGSTCPRWIWSQLVLTTVTAAFFVNEGLQVEYDNRFTLTSKYQEEVRICVPEPSCGMVLGDWAAATITSVTGWFDLDIDKMHLEIAITHTGGPGYRYPACPNRGTDPPYGGQSGRYFLFFSVTSPEYVLDYSHITDGWREIRKFTVNPYLKTCR
jgi:hypothetical protein